MSTEPDSGRWYRDHWRETVMEVAEGAAKAAQACTIEVRTMDERIKVLERGGRWVLGVAGTIVAAGIVALATWLLERP